MGKNRIPFPKTVFEFARWFPDDKACIGYLYQSRWPQSFVCPKCASTKAPPYMLDKYKRIECSSCGHQTSVTAGTAPECPLRCGLRRLIMSPLTRRGFLHFSFRSTSVLATRRPSICFISYGPQWFVLNGTVSTVRSKWTRLLSGLTSQESEAEEQRAKPSFLAR